MNLCRDCRWAKARRIDALLGIWQAAKCTNPAVGKDPIANDPVSGQRVGGEWPFCATIRMYSDEECGRDGKLWEARK